MKKHLGVSVPEEIKDRLERMSDKMGVSITTIVKKAIIDLIKSRPKKSDFIKKEI